jgi:hypothetical protein
VKRDDNHLFRHTLTGLDKENHEKYQSGQPVFWPMSEPGTSDFKSRLYTGLLSREKTRG